MFNRRGPVPIYRLISDKIRSRIESGKLKPGYAVPSEKEITSEYKVARITARLAVRHLRDQGFVYTIQGKGSFVDPESAPRVSRRVLIHQSIAEALIERIRSGQLKPDLPIPSETQLMQEHEVAKGTIRQAVQYLRELGWVYTVPQRGTYVQPRENWPAKG